MEVAESNILPIRAFCLFVALCREFWRFFFTNIEIFDCLEETCMLLNNVKVRQKSSKKTEIVELFSSMFCKIIINKRLSIKYINKEM